MSITQRLELTWVGKHTRPQLEPRILLTDESKSHAVPLEPGTLWDEAYRRLKESGDWDGEGPGPAYSNLLIHGDNLLALKALENEYAGKVKCVFIDPPYNTGSAFTHYDDGVEHSIWLTLMRDRLELLAMLLAEDGSIWITIDDREAHYLKVLCDEVFGRSAFIATCIWQKRYSRENREAIGDVHDYVLVYAPNPAVFKQNRNLIELTEKQRAMYKNPDGDPRGAWQSVSLLAQGYRPNQMYTITAPNGNTHVPPPGNCWKVIESNFLELVRADRVYFGKDGNGVPRRKEFLSKSGGLVPWTWWPHEEVGHTDEALKEMQALFTKENVFATPKPERLLARIIHISTNPGDLVLDSFAGSGTTGAVAHKMGRRWVMVELGDHCDTHVVPRLKKVVEGKDPGGVTESTKWNAGGGYRYCDLAPSMLLQDKFGNQVINPDYNPEMLAEAMCKHLGFSYAPSREHYWMHGQSNETDFLFVTTQTITQKMMVALADGVGDERTLLVCCSAWRGNPDLFPKLTFKKIPPVVLAKCEWGQDDYSSFVSNLKRVDPDAIPGTLFDQDNLSPNGEVNS